jgi:hypothetical protein
MKTLITPPREINEQTLRAFLTELCDIINMRFGDIPEDSTAVDIAGLVADFNGLLERLR